MKIHPDWSDNGSVAITFDDDGDDASETYSDFSRLLKHFNVNFTTFKLRGSTTASMVIPVSCTSQKIEDNVRPSVEDTPTSNNEVENSENTENENEGDGVVIKKKKKKVSTN